MKLLVDSGSTKADWIAIDDEGKTLFSTQSLGLNPEILSEEQVIERLNDRFDIAQNRLKVTHLYFYGAGCGTDRMKTYFKAIFQKYFENADLRVYEDTYAAVFATTPIGESSIVCILGTGSNCSYFDGEILHQKVQSLGYIAMDDCSGNRFGKRLLRAYYFNKMPDELRLIFEKAYDVSADAIKENLYKKDNPNAYLATFAKFLIEHKNHPFIQEMIREEMELFVDNYIKQFDNCKNVPIHFVGSIAFYLQEELREVLESHQLQLGTIYRRPIDGLIHYHLVSNL